MTIPDKLNEVFEKMNKLDESKIAYLYTVADVLLLVQETEKINEKIS